MRFALLGADSESIALARAAVSNGHSIDWCGDLAVAGIEDEWASQDQGGLWEELLDGELVDAVIVGRGKADSNFRGEQVGQLTKSGMPVLTTFPLVDSVLTFYEIDMARGESNAILQHFNPLAEHRAIVEACSEWIAAEHPTLGRIEQVVWERPLSERTQENVLWHFSRDVELLTLIAGGLNRLGALGSPDEAATYAGLSVQLLGKSEVPVRWQVGPVEQDECPCLVLIAEQGKVKVEFDGANRATHISANRAGEVDSSSVEQVDAASQTIARFVDAANNGGDSSSTTWTRALAAMELTDTIEIALRRGRMIEVHQQQLTEQMAFKGTMSAVGCGVLLTIPPLLLFLGWIAELVGLPVAKYWPHVLLVLLALFLGLQLIPKLVFKADD